MFISNKIKLVVLFAGISAFSLSCQESPAVESPHTGADWFHAVRTNVNAMAFSAGVLATWHALYYAGIPATKAGIEYALGKIDKPEALKKLKKSGKKFITSLFLAGFAGALEGFNKVYLRPCYYEKVAALHAAKAKATPSNG